MSTAPEEKKFPPQFFWGASTSAHQIEGGLNNDWTAWETSEKRLKELKEKNLHASDFISGHAANSFVEQNADIQCLVDLGVNAYRFSVDWSRIEPQEGVYDMKALEYYASFITKLRSHNIEPFVTLWHWPIPLWVRNKGGFESPDIAHYFGRFAEKVVSHLHSNVHFWITLNEPMVYSSMSYLVGTWPPQKKNPLAYLRVIRHLAEAHITAYQVIKDIDPESAVGIAKQNIYFEAYGNQPQNRFGKFLVDWWWNHRFLHKIQKYSDFIGLNYYFHAQVHLGSRKKPDYEKRSDLGWGLFPEGIYYLLKDLKQYKKPIYITENGLADKGDQHRSWYIHEILSATYRAIEEGVDVKGYFHWSLIDNFEWADGFHPKFGLFEVDYKTFERRPRPSSQFYADICRNNRVV